MNDLRGPDIGFVQRGSSFGRGSEIKVSSIFRAISSRLHEVLKDALFGSPFFLRNL